MLLHTVNLKTYFVVKLENLLSALIYKADLEEDVPLSRNGLAALLAKQGGMVPLLQGRIVGGAAVSIEQFPWIISMQHLGGHRCGGSIISTTRLELKRSSYRTLFLNLIFPLQNIVSCPLYCWRWSNHFVGESRINIK